ncbi:hypothetical protein HZH66_008950 [Vespula vulgaris]|uniref:Uncharacterized protein n=1 Tax=Vespula vulgaris TaxID=7454 RepID=A0A834JTA8_VESVU|nr:hypothetical protein HZH66_008950 [Vespula vulgaris]
MLGQGGRGWLVSWLVGWLLGWLVGWLVGLDDGVTSSQTGEAIFGESGEQIEGGQERWRGRVSRDEFGSASLTHATPHFFLGCSPRIRREKEEEEEVEVEVEVEVGRHGIFFLSRVTSSKMWKEEEEQQQQEEQERQEQEEEIK